MTNRGMDASTIKSMVKDGRTIYNIFAIKNEKGKFDIFVKKNDKVYTLDKNVGVSVKNVNKKIMEIANFYNSSNNIKRLKEIVRFENEVEKNHKRLVRMRENKIKRINAARNKASMKTKKVVVPSDVKNLMLSLSYVK